MKFFIDQPISWEVARNLRQEGFDAVHVRDVGLAAADDAVILERAANEQRVVVTQDTDYGTLLVTGALSAPSVILFRMKDGTAAAQTKALFAALDLVEDELLQGAIVVIGDASVRVRRLRP